MVKTVSKKRNKKILFLTTIAAFAILTSIITYKIFKSHTECASEKSNFKDLPLFNKEELAKYDGIKNDLTYIGYHCFVYDVTDEKNTYYGEERPYHYLVGRDATQQLEIFGGDIIESKYKKVGILK